MSYFSDLHITGQEEGRAGMHAQLVRDFVSLGRTPTAAHAAADEILAPKSAPADLDASPVFDHEPVARPVAQRLGLTPMRAGVVVETVRDHVRPGMTAECLAGLTGLPLETVLVVLDELGLQAVRDTRAVRLPHDPVMRDAWQQLYTHGLGQKQVGLLFLIVVIPSVSLMALAGFR